MEPLSVLFEYHIRIPRRELHELFLLPLLRDHKFYARAALRGKPVREERRVRKLFLQPDFLRNKGCPRIELLHKALEQFLALIFHRNVKVVVLSPHDSALADKENLDDRLSLVAPQRNDVPILHAVGGNLLSLFDVLYAVQKIPNFRGALKFHLRRRRFHLRLQLFHDRRKAAV